jgi:GNAT superfamily N-acetyltransferase
MRLSTIFAVRYNIMQILRAPPNDAVMLTEIAFAAKRHWGYPERWIESWRNVLTVTPEFIVAHETYAAVVDGRSVGFYALAPKENRLDLLHLWVLPDAMGQGVGRSLFLHALERARALGFRELEIESDPNAAGFYERLGARRVGTSICEVEQQPRQLPIFTYQINHAA